MDALTFLRELYGDAAGWLTIWTRDKQTTWYKLPPDGMKCSYKEGTEAVQYVVLVLKQHGYTEKEIGNIFREITPHNYKYEIVKEELAKRGIEL